MATAAGELRPGAKFLLRRLARATAIPAAERPPTVAAFVESVQLLREACDLLPLTADGSPALRFNDPPARQQMQLAFLKVAMARYISPETPECDRAHDVHLAAYCNWWLSQADRGARSSGLEAVLLLVAASQEVTRFEAVDASGRAAALLENDSDRLAVSRQLEQLAGAAGLGKPPLSIQQLRYLCCWTAAGAVSELYMAVDLHQQAAQHGASLPAALQAGMDGPPPARLDALRAAGRSFTAQLLQLEPHNLKSFRAAALSAGFHGQWAEATDLNLQYFRRAQEQLDVWSIAKSAQAAVVSAASASIHAPASISRSTLEAVVAAHQQAQQAELRCKQLLPQVWAEAVRPDSVTVQPCLQVVQAALRGQPLQLQYTSADAERAVDRMVNGVVCDGCGKHSAGLRRCSRCKKAQYCSTKCQHQHWKTHKRDCQPV